HENFVSPASDRDVFWTPDTRSSHSWTWKDGTVTLAECARSARVAGVFFCLTLVLLVHVERRLSEVEFDLLPQSRIDSHDRLDRDAITPRLVALLDTDLPTVGVPNRPAWLPPTPSVESTPEGAHAAPTSRGPPLARSL